ncbi:MAG: type I-C CRISPR-associated protein Cas5 [Magnetococcales bacterium]|nr:type I-C CRISPR-associated protein Cas5 [Magnetococcales bacterium]
MNFGIQLLVWGDYACWTRPEMKAERVSYDVMTPSGARGILEAIYWKPQIRWVIDRIRVLAPIRFVNLRRNEVKFTRLSLSSRVLQGKEPAPAIYVDENREQRASLLLQKVQYGIEAHLQLLDKRERDGTQLRHPQAKHLDQFFRRARAGACYHRPYLGCREFPAHFAVVDAAHPFPAPPPELQLERELGFMLYDIDHDGYPAAVGPSHRCSERCRPRFFRAKLVDGLLDVAACLQQSRQEFGL